MSDFDFAFDLITGPLIEGGYSNDPQDPGGETKYGICKRDFPNLDIKNLTLEQVKPIYKSDYWDAVKGDQLPYPLNVAVFDAAVNQGVDAAKRMLQKSLNVPQDGILGVQTMKAAQSTRNEFITLYLANRAMRYTGTRNFDRFGQGWFRRLFTLAINTRR